MYSYVRFIVESDNLAQSQFTVVHRTSILIINHENIELSEWRNMNKPYRHNVQRWFLHLRQIYWLCRLGVQICIDKSNSTFSCKTELDFVSSYIVIDEKCPVGNIEGAPMWMWLTVSSQYSRLVNHVNNNIHLISLRY